MSASSPTCSSLHHLAKAWQDSLEDSKASFKTFQENFDDESRATLTKALEKTRQAQTDYETEANALVNWKGKQVIAREAVLLEWMKGQVGKVNIEVSDTGEVTILYVSENKNTAESDINNAMKFCTVFQGLQKLFCFNTNLTKLPELPDGLKTLDCSNTNLTKLPELPNELITLVCHKTNISELPKLPDGLQRLYCFNTNLTKLPELPNGLRELYCLNTNLTKLPELPNGLRELDCSSTNLSTLPDPLPDSLKIINIENTPAAEDQAVKQKLDAFRWAHPGAEVVY